ARSALGQTAARGGRPSSRNRSPIAVLTDQARTHRHPGPNRRVNLAAAVERETPRTNPSRERRRAMLFSRGPQGSREARMQALSTDVEILIAGAGPTGLALAAELARRGINPLIIDRQAAGANTSRACVVHARTLEVLEPLGVTRDLLAQGLKVPIFRIRDRDRSLIT